MMGSLWSVGHPCTRLIPLIKRRRLRASAVGSGSPCSRCRFRTADKYTLMDCGFSLCVKKVANSMSVFSEAGRGDPLGCRQLYVSANVMKLCVAELYVVQVDVAREC